MATMEILEVLKYLGLFIGFGVAALAWAAVAFVTNTRWWHEKHHRDGLRIMCDRCMGIGR